MAIGRPRAFDTDKALDSALMVFWRKGYEGASLPDLTKAMGINRPSLYAAFGNKEALFRKVVDRYNEGPASFFRDALEEKSVRGVLEKLFAGSIDLLTDPKNPRGCLLVQGALACGESAEAVQEKLTACRAAGDVALRRRFERAAAEGDLAADLSAADLARYVSTVMHGMAVQAASGASRETLRRVAKMALRCCSS